MNSSAPGPNENTSKSNGLNPAVSTSGPEAPTGFFSRTKLTWIGGILLVILSSSITWCTTYYSGHIAKYTEVLYEAKGLIAEKEEEWVKNALITSLPLDESDRDALVSSLSDTRVAISSLYSNDIKVDSLASQYKIALEEALGAVNRFDGSKERLEVMANSLQNAANIGGELGNEIGVLNASFKRKFAASLSSREARVVLQGG